MTVSPHRKDDPHPHPDLRLAPQLQNLSYFFSGTLPAKDFPEKRIFSRHTKKEAKR
jgi:hypothetical protein